MSHANRSLYPIQKRAGTDSVFTESVFEETCKICVFQLLHRQTMQDFQAFCLIIDQINAS